MSKIISHNSFSYLPVKQWWLKPFTWIARCQDIDLHSQSLYENVEGIDLRIRFDKDDTPVIAHGLVNYKIDFWEELNNENIKVARVILETTPFMSKYQRAHQKALFWKVCDILESIWGHMIVFYGGWPRDEWRKKVYNFKTKEPEVTEMHGSVSGCKLNCLWLKRWAKKHNKEIIDNCKTEYAMIDFVEYD